MYSSDFLSEEQQGIVRVFRDFGERVFTDETVSRWSFDQGLPDEVVQEFSSLYFKAVPHDSAENSGVKPLFEQALIIEELCRCAGASLPMQTDLFGLQILEAFASSNDIRPVLEDYRKTGRVMFALAVSEPQAGSDSMNMQTNVKTIDGKLVLNGMKNFVSNGEYAPNILVAAIDKDDTAEHRYPPLSFWLIPRDLKGIAAAPINKIGQPMLPFATMSFDHVELKPEYRLSGSNGNHGSFPKLFEMLQCGRVFTCAASLGMAQAAMEDATRYAAKRVAFGAPIDTFQQIQQMLTDMEVRLWNMRNLTYKAALAISSNSPDKRLAAALMKRYVPKAATEVASDAMQILGGVGYTESERVSRIWEDCRGNQLAEGTDQIMVYIAAPLIRDKYAD